MSDSSPTNTNTPSFLDGPNGRLAYEKLDGKGPTIVWLGGFRSDMTGTKATHLKNWAKATGRAFLRFDYSGHGQSEGVFEQGCISDWTNDARAAIDIATTGPLILVGSSMGGWVTALLAQQISSRIAGIVFIAPAPDFTEELMWPSLSEQDRETIMQDGKIETPSDYSDEPTIITRKLIEDGRENLVLTSPITIDAPVRILQGMKDPDVPWQHAMRLAEKLTSDDLTIGITKTGDHSLSTPADLQRLTAAIVSIG